MKAHTRMEHPVDTPVFLTLLQHILRTFIMKAETHSELTVAIRSFMIALPQAAVTYITLPGSPPAQAAVTPIFIPAQRLAPSR